MPKNRRLCVKFLSDGYLTGEVRDDCKTTVAIRAVVQQDTRDYGGAHQGG